MKLKTISICLVAISFFSACNKSSDSGKALTEAEMFEKGISLDLEQRLTPDNYEISMSSSDYKDEENIRKNFYAENKGLGCSTDEKGNFVNKYSENPKIVEKDLRIGEEINEANVYVSNDDITETSTNWKLAQLTNNQVIYHLNYNYMKNLLTGISQDINSFFSTSPHASLTYSKENTDGKIQLNFSQKALDLIKQNEGKNAEFKYWDCSVDSSGKHQTTTSLIQYNLNGKKVNALLRNYNSSGKMKCEQRLTRETSKTTGSESSILNTVEFENGETSYKTIHSRAVKSKYLVACEGVELFYQSYTKGNGKLLKFNSSKILSAPVR